MIDNLIIPVKRFADVFLRLGWKQSKSKSNKYDVWTSPLDKNIWTIVPNDINSEEYKYYANKNIKVILYALDMAENDINIYDIRSQLINYNYKLLNKIVTNKNLDNDSIPYELANVLPSKNVAALRSYYNYKNKGKKDLPISNFEMNHTQQGSFIIPVSIRVEDDNEKFKIIPSDTNIILREYLDIIDELVKIEPRTKEEYASKVMEYNIDSRIVKDFVDQNGSIAKYKENYKDKVKDMTITSKSNPILDYNLKPQDKIFKVVDLSYIKPLSEEFIEYLEEKEIKADSAYLSSEDANIDVSVDSLDQNGTAKFSVFSINGETMKRPFKAFTLKQTKSILNTFADAFKSRDLIVINGDIEKPRGKSGTIYITSFKLKKKDPELF